MGVGFERCPTPIPAFPLKGKEFLGVLQILFSDISLNRTPHAALI